MWEGRGETATWHRPSRKSMTDMFDGSSKSETSQGSAARCFANSSNRLDEYINCLVVTQRWPVDQITRSLTSYRRAPLYCALPMQTQYGSSIGRLIKLPDKLFDNIYSMIYIRLRIVKLIWEIRFESPNCKSCGSGWIIPSSGPFKYVAQRVYHIKLYDQLTSRFISVRQQMASLMISFCFLKVNNRLRY